MTLDIDPAAVRRAWSHGVDADLEVAAARGRTTAAGSGDLDAVTDCVADAASDMAGVLDVVRAVITEHHTGMESCLATFAATDRQSAGEFDALDR
ncbi:MAG: hypothetical protein Q8O61_08985 [Nocardioides sp.]|nr:hypothetical protein [Nocardioides sp.]